MKNIIARILAWFSGDLVQKIIKCLPQIVVEAEKAMADGIITADERKEFATNAVNIIANNLGVKLNAITKWIISQIINAVAKKLPSKDIKVPEAIMQLKKEIGG